MAATKGVYRLLEYLIIKQIYGQAAWDQGLRVIDRHGNLSNGEELGVYSIAEALKLVGARREDLIEIEPHTDPPVCQSIDYAKYRQQPRTQ